MQKSIEVQQENTVIYSFSAILAGLYFYIFRKMIGIWGLWAFPIFGVLAYVIVHFKDQATVKSMPNFTGVTGSNNLASVALLNAATPKNGIDGSNGKDGTSFLSGQGLPSDANGKNGDSYVDTVSGNWYLKQNNTWF